jgi:uncharacterized protein (TIRG00374 family)
VKNIVRNTLGIALSVALLWWALHDVHWTSVRADLAKTNLPLLVLAALVATCDFPLRAWRWRPILSPVAPGLGFGVLFRATCIGMALNNVIPARIGELFRAYALSREEKRVPFSAAFASLAVDRVFDACIVLLLMVVAAFDPSFPRGTMVAGQPLSRWVGGGAILVAAAFTGLYMLVFFPDRLLRLYELLARRVAPRFEARGREALMHFTAGLGVLRHPGRFAIVFLWTLAHWLVNALSFWIGFRAVGIHTSFGSALLLQGLIAIGVAVPQGPGFFGVFEALAKAGLVLYGVDSSLAVTWAVGFHILSFIPVTVMGLWFFWTLGLHMSDIEREQRA